MKSYELIFVVRPDLTDGEVGTIRSDVRNQISTLNGSIEKEDPWGRRQLAFEIKDCTEGIYTMFDVKLPPESSNKLNDQLKIDERIIRYMITIKEDKKPNYTVRT